MNTDFRITVGYLQHPKTKKLKKRLGADAVLAHIQLFEFTATCKPDGNLSNMSAEDIVLASDYNGKGDFVSVLVDLRLLDLADGVYRVHDWIEHNPWASGASKRSIAGKKAASVRWDKGADEDGSDSNGNTQSCEPQCDNDATAMRSHAEGNAPSPFLSNSYPTPSPTPYPEESPQPPEGAPGASLGGVSTDDKFDVRDYFTQFWTVYPLKKAKDAAERKFCTKVRSPETFDAVMAGLSRAMASTQWTKDDGRFIPHASTWLNAGGWKDEDGPKPTALKANPIDPNDPATRLAALVRPYVSQREAAH